MRVLCACASREAHGGHIRVSSHFYNTREDIDTFIEKYMGIIG